MKLRIKNIISTIKSISIFCLSLIYEERAIKISSDKLDSRTIPPPRYGNLTEKTLCESRSNDAVFSYATHHVHSSIYWFKYKRDKYTIKFLSRALADEIIWTTSDKLDNRSNINEWIVTFAPSTSFHRGDKKWDHNEDIYEEMRKNLNFTFQKIFGFSNQKILSNKKLRRNDRQNLSTHKFSLLPEVKIPPHSGLIIFDDVTTTGSTLANLTRLAEKLNPKIILTIAIAH